MCEEENPQPEYPLSVDIKITDRCNNGCPYCYESSTPEGCDGDEKIIELIKALPKETEVALGGGNPLESGLLEAILWNCNVNLSFTINQRDMDSLFSKDWFKKSYKEKEGSSLRDYINLRAVGVSVSQVDDETVEKLLALQKKFQTVVHVVAGVITLKELKKLYGKTKRLLILGYKQCGRGEEYLSPAVKERISRLADSIEEISKHFEIVAFDNLAIEQLNVKKLVSDSEWERLYQGEEGEFSMYIDAVKGEYAASSYSKERHRIEQGMSIKEMFENIRREKREN
jgi:organic radical activating enzyme